MALLNIGDDSWLLEYEACEKLQRDIMEQLTLRSRQARTSEKFSQLSALIRSRLKQYSNEVSDLNTKLGRGARLTPAELERRKRQLELLQSKGVQMQNLFDDQLMKKNTEERSQLFGATSTNYAGDYEAKSVDELRRDQESIIQEQDKGLDSLYEIISRQKNIAQTISNEVDLHNDILDDLDTRTERINNRVRTETQHISVVDQKDNTCGYWIVIIILFVGIILVSII